MTATAIVCPSGIYAITNTVNGKKYIGSAVKIKARWATHKTRLEKCNHHSPKLQMAWNKYGPDSFAFSVVEYVHNKNDLLAREQEWIDALSASGVDGYNICPTAGNWLGRKHSPETMAKMVGRKLSPEQVEKMTGWTHTPESLAKMRGRKMSSEQVEKMRGSKRTPETIAKMRQRKLSPEAIEALRIANTGRKQTPEHVEKKRAAITGLKRSQEQVERMRVVSTGKRHSVESLEKLRAINTGKKQTPETKAKMAASQMLRRERERVSKLPA